MEAAQVAINFKSKSDSLSDLPSINSVYYANSVITFDEIDQTSPVGLYELYCLYVSFINL